MAGGANVAAAGSMGLSRRQFLEFSAGAGAAALWAPYFAAAAAARPQHILFTNCWHNINIGDIAHAPGLLRLLEVHLPETRVTLWPYRELTPEVKAMIVRAFPKLTILEPGGVSDGKVTRADLAAAMDDADLFINGSGGYHPKPTAIWRATTGGKRWGAYGVSFSEAGDVETLSSADFIYCRDTVSLEVLKKAGVKAKTLDFGPDSTFGLQLPDVREADDYMRRTDLREGQYLCVVPRLRYSPYWEIYQYGPTADEQAKAKINEAHKVQDHQSLRELIINWVRKTGCKVLACPEMTYGVQLAKEQLVDPLPEDVRKNVVWRDSFWLCDEAAQVYRRAAVVVSLDCHSPIIALVNGTPAIHLRLPSDTRKSQMFADIGLPEWVHESTALSGTQLTELAMEIHARPAANRRKVQSKMDYVRECQAATMEVIAGKNARR